MYEGCNKQGQIIRFITQVSVILGTYQVDTLKKDTQGGNKCSSTWMLQSGYYCK